jgi:hypothetical protein
MTRDKLRDEVESAVQSQSRAVYDFTVGQIANFELAANDIVTWFNSLREPGQSLVERDFAFREPDKAFAQLRDGLYANNDGVMSFAIRISFSLSARAVSLSCPLRAGLRFTDIAKTVHETLVSLQSMIGGKFPEPPHGGECGGNLDIVIWLPEDDSALADTRASLRVEGTRYGCPATPPDKTQSRGLHELYDRISREFVKTAKVPFRER